MFISVTIGRSLESAPANFKFPGKSRQASPGTLGFSGPEYHLISKHRAFSVLSEQFDAPVLGCPSHVFCVCDVFKIVNRVVSLIGIFVVNFAPVRYWTQESPGYECVDRAALPSTFTSEGNGQVALPGCLLHCLASPKLKANNISEVTNLIIPFKPRYRFPYFTNHRNKIVTVKEVVNYA